MVDRSGVNRALKRWPGWLAMGLVLVVFLVVGATRATGPQTPADRVDDITKRLACPVCDGESVFESQNNSSRAIRNEVEVLVRANELSDAEILAVFETRNSEILLVPKASGFDALVWVLPTMGFVIGVAALAFAFRRWRVDAAGVGDPSDDDRALVAAALAGTHAEDSSGADGGAADRPGDATEAAEGGR